MMIYYHIISYSKEPAKAYGIAVDPETRMVKSVPYDHQEVSWMKNYTIDALVKFLEGKPVIICEVK